LATLEGRRGHTSQPRKRSLAPPRKGPLLSSHTVAFLPESSASARLYETRERRTARREQVVAGGREAAPISPFALDIFSEGIKARKRGCGGSVEIHGGSKKDCNLVILWRVRPAHRVRAVVMRQASDATDTLGQLSRSCSGSHQNKRTLSASDIFASTLTLETSSAMEPASCEHPAAPTLSCIRPMRATAEP